MTKAREWTAKHRIGELDTLSSIRATQARVVRAVAANKISTNFGDTLVSMLAKIGRTLLWQKDLELREREVAAREMMAKHLAEIVANPNRQLRPQISVRIETIDSTPPRVRVIDGEAVETVELPELTAPSDHEPLN
jgi:hypothetical protein